jgi:transcriptional regulator with GAF, ATPase, and Fis domain/AmiR/NasT family two-component response regulator
MSRKILIVEDQFIEANDLKIILEGAGHKVCGVAKSYDHACLLLERERPDFVLLDIFLTGKLTGLDFAAVLSKENIPFIYLSANSNQSVLETAKTTRPYGFLVKPFRDKDVLVALDIAGYRHEHHLELMDKQEKLLSNILAGILGEKSNAENMLLRLAHAFKPSVPFDFAFIDVDLTNDDLDSLFCLKRTGFDEYDVTTGSRVKEDMHLDAREYIDWRKATSTMQGILLENIEELEVACKKNPFVNVMIKASGAQSRLIVPLLSDGGVHMGVRFYSKEPQAYTADHLELLNPLRSLLSMVIDTIRRQKGNMAASVTSETRQNHAAKIPQIEGIVGRSTKLLHALDLAVQVANFDLTALILGETGVGKEGLVQAIHQLSGRSKKPLVKINCAAIPSLLIESELFGHEKGSFTGAYDRRIGKFEQAQGGTVFLDEIGELPLEVQTKLLRVLQERELERIGGRTTINIDVRVIAATNRNLHKDVTEGRFRMDLFYRINVFPIVLPPLRERKDDIPLLTEHFLRQHAVRSGTEPKRLSSSVSEQLLNYSWPGNIRELQHVMERSIVLSHSNIITRVDLPVDIMAAEPIYESIQETFRSIAEVDRDHIIAALTKCNGRVSGKGGAAEMLNIPATTLNSKMKKLGISWKFLY